MIPLFSLIVGGTSSKRQLTVTRGRREYESYARRWGDALAWAKSLDRSSMKYLRPI